MTKRERVLSRVLVGVVVAVVVTVAAIQVLGNEPGEPCVDSYSCSGFLVGGAECVAVDEGAYCTRYCDRDDECPPGWKCLGATPTVLTVETTATDEICVRP